MENKLLLIDGHSLIFRMYYAFLRHPMVNSKGVDVSILYGFTKYLLELVEKEHPSHLAVCFDPPGKTFRHQLFPDYKGTRQAAPELVIDALEPLKELCEAMDIPVLMRPGFEGDDVLGAMAVRSAEEGMMVYMVTPDKDFGQLINDRIYQYKPGKGGADAEIWGPRQICEKFSLQTPSQFVDILTICGDASDNVPGVSGIGEVGASKLIARYGSVENIYSHLDELSPRQRELFDAARDHISLSKTLVTIRTDIPLDDVSADDMLYRAEKRARAFELFDHYEFPSLKKFLTLAEGETVATQTDYKSMDYTVLEPAAFAAEARKCGAFAVRMEPGVSADGASGIAITVAASGAVSSGEAGQFRAILEDPAIRKIGYDLKKAVKMLPVEGPLDDIELMHYLINPEASHKVEILSRQYLGVNIEESDDSAEPVQTGSLFDEVPVEEDSRRGNAKARREALAAYLLDGELLQLLQSLSMERLYRDIEEPLIRVLAGMESTGVKMDLGSLDEYAASLRKDLLEIEGKVRLSAGVPDANLSSPKQVGQMLFETLRIDPRMKPRKDAKNAYPTDEETLLGYADSFPIIYDILEYRSVKKLLGTYIEPFAQWISPRDGRIHTTFNQALTATGRLSSSRPNLQNIPVRTDRGRQIRAAFVSSDPDKVIVSADYSQIELRLMAHFCRDPHMIEAFSRGEDVHSATAAKIFGVDPEEVSSDMRRTAKTANFGIIYGISAFGLSQRLHIPRVAAKKLIEDYFAGFPAIGQWIEQTRQNARQSGYVQTLFGRRRYLPDINSRNATTRALAERNAVNAPIQGTAADIIKIAMINVNRRIRQEGLSSRMVLQIHDELLFEAPRGEVVRLCDMIKYEMEHVIALDVPLTVECNYGTSWLEAH